MLFSLDKLACNLGYDQYKSYWEIYKRAKVFKLTRHKGVYSYENMDTWEKFAFTEKCILQLA